MSIFWKNTLSTIVYLLLVLCPAGCTDPNDYLVTINNPGPPVHPPQHEPSDPPLPSFRVTPESGTVFTIFEFDASSTTDPDHQIEYLSFRWDWNDDGTYETEWSASCRTSKRFPTCVDTIRVRLQVRDPGGEEGTYTGCIYIEPVPIGSVTHLISTASDNLNSPSIGEDGTVYLSGKTIYALYGDGGLKWWFYGYGYTSPAVGNEDRLYAGSIDGSLYALGSTHGGVHWQYHTNGGIESSPAIGEDGTIYFGSRDSHLYALTAGGSLRWKYMTGQEIISSPAIGADGTIYIGSRDGYLYALNPDGSLLWRFAAQGSGHCFDSSPAIGEEGRIYTGCSDQNFYALSPDGTLIWKYPVGAEVHSSPCIGADGTLYFGADDGYLYALDPGGSMLWNFRTEDKIRSSPAAGSDGTVYVGSNDEYLYAIDSSGNLVMMYWQGGNNCSPAITQSGKVYVGGCSLVSQSMGLADSPWPKFRANSLNTGRR